MNESKFSPPVELNTLKDKYRYPFKPTYKQGYVFVYLKRETYEPVCKVPINVTSKVGFRRIAWVVKRLANAGQKDSQIRKAAEADYRSFRDRHLVSTVRLGDLKSVTKDSIALERRGENFWPDDVWAVPDHPELMALRLPVPAQKKKR